MLGAETMVPWVKSKEASKLEEAMVRSSVFLPATQLAAYMLNQCGTLPCQRLQWHEYFGCVHFCGFWLWFGWRDPRVTCPVVMFVRLALATAQLPLHLGLVIPQLESNM